MTSRTTAAKKAATTKAPPKAYTVPKGYEIKYPHGSYDLLKKSKDAKTEGPAWWVTCNTHGNMTEAATAKAGDALGTRVGLAGWCKGNHKATAKKTTTA